MATGVVSWSQTAANNASADSTVNWAEGQAPSTINDSARSEMASVAKYRDDNAGSLITGGTSTAYTLTSNQGFASKSAMNGVEIAFTVNTTNGTSPTLNVDSLGGDPITLDGTTAVPTGTLIAGSIYTAMYYFSGTAWRLKDFYQLPFVVPVGGMIDYFGTTAPGSNFVLPFGQAISRSTYSALFTLFSTTFGTGDGSTTFNIPDLRGRIVAGKDDMGGSAASRLTSTYFGTSAATLGAVGGNESKALITTNLPAQTPSGTVAITGISAALKSAATTGTDQGSFLAAGNTGGSSLGNGGAWFASGTATFSGAAFSGQNATPVAIAQPTIIANKLLRII